MQVNVFLDKVRFHFFLFPFFAALALFTLPYGCKQEQQSDQQKQVTQITLENLQIAYGKSVKHKAMYETFAQRAEKERLREVANLYRAVAHSEGIHAYNHAQLMRSHGIDAKMPALDSLSIGTTLQTLKMALSSEEIEVESMYANLIRTAEMEKFPEAVQQFENTRNADTRQMELMKEALDKNGKIVKSPYFVCAGCGFIMTSDKTVECPTCHAKKDRFQKIS
ncbi:MAG TPA: ferritin family protein [Saprospiraceae bacterium]|nr:ferritin family protein [Saprospiraceae bacterium]